MIKRIFVSGSNITHNIKQEELKKMKLKSEPVKPVVFCRDENRHTIETNELIIFGQDGKEAARVKYDLRRGDGIPARVWIETENKVEPI